MACTVDFDFDSPVVFSSEEEEAREEEEDAAAAERGDIDSTVDDALVRSEAAVALRRIRPILGLRLRLRNPSTTTTDSDAVNNTIIQPPSRRMLRAAVIPHSDVNLLFCSIKYKINYKCS